MKLPRYPVYIPSKGRYAPCYTAARFLKDGVPFRLVVEEAEHDEYASRYGEDNVLVLPFSNKGLIASRNWIKQHSISEGHQRHWQFDDNITSFRRIVKGVRQFAQANLALCVCEDLTDRYTNVAISGLNYSMFCVSGQMPPFYLNHRVYSMSLVNNAIPHEWRLAYNDDTDICLQVLADGWCTILLNAFNGNKLQTMVLSGGNTDSMYKIDDGRLKMARSLERVWPYIVKTDRRFQRPQHVVRDNWTKFDNKLIRRPDLDWDKLSQSCEYTLEQVERPRADFSEYAK